ncbi:hypothetical protein ACFQZ4_47550 [Catellatospora coxensis]|uniref:Uncharacterized protein n=1 Tax=Catellatospora coxensis TaxID=310354 RepID=A0A8J3KRH7_9ACTN|nr:hypothetical protein [Catellatospora coxensis]GIG07328.1 hypothetical protein Cco03nite_40280 [Catellatospora coxensis]
MIRRVCNRFLTAAARRWPAELRDEMLAEWRAELHAMPGTARRLRYAASLAASRPHRAEAVAVRPGRSFAHAVLSLVLVMGMAVLCVRITIDWYTGFSEETIAWQAWAAAGGLVIAVGLGIICARVTTGVTQLIRPVFTPLWICGIVYTMSLSWPLVEGYQLTRSAVIDQTCWLLSAVVLCALAGRIARSGRVALSWAVVGVAVLVSFYFAHMHNTLSHFDSPGMEMFFDGAFLRGYLVAVVTQWFLHLTIFLLVYAHSLVLRHQAGQAQVSLPPVPA